MKAAIYARKSTEQNVAEEAKSVTRQVENAREFAAKRGWLVDEEHVYIDDGISGAEYDKRPGLQRMLAAAERRRFEALIVSERKSIGREQFETGMKIKELARAGVEVFEYVHGKSLTPRTAMEKFQSSAHGFADELHREQTSERMREALKRVASQGYVTGGRVYGYTNKHVFSGKDAHGNPLRSHVDREVNPKEAAIVRRIFEMYAGGEGLKKIAKALNSEKAPSPRYSAPKDGMPGIGAWAPSTVRAILGRDIYRGEPTWNKRRKRDEWGQADRIRSRARRPEGEWVRASREDLRIVSDDLWRRVASRRADVEGKAIRFASGRLSGRPPKSETQNLLAGLARCGECGGGMVVNSSSGPREAFTIDSLPKPGEPIRRAGRYFYYGCHRRRQTGTCSNSIRMNVEDVNEAVLQSIEQHALTPEAIEDVIQLTERDDVRAQQDRLTKEAQEIEKRNKRLLDAIESGGDAQTIVARVKENEAKLRSIRTELAGLCPIPRLAPAVVASRLEEWRRLLRSSITQGRAVLQRILSEPIIFMPRADGGYDFACPTRYDKLFTGIAVPVRGAADLWRDQGLGTENIRPEDTLEHDYERLLATAAKNHAKGVATLEGFEPSIFTLKG
jgi:site-specific DNA recombinase